MYNIFQIKKKIWYLANVLQNGIAYADGKVAKEGAVDILVCCL